MRNKVYIIDPQSVNSLAAYDWNMIADIHNIDIHFFGNENYNDNAFNQNVIFTPIFKYSKYSNPFLKGFSYLLSLLIIFFYGIKERPMILHLQWLRIWILDWWFIRFFKCILKTKFIFTVHNILPRKRNKNTFKRFHKLYEFADILIVHTQTSKNKLEKKFQIIPEKIIVMPHGILEMKVSIEKLKEAEERLNANHIFDNKIIFGALGVQNPYKGTDLLIKAWRESSVLSTAQNAILLIAGKPSGMDIPTDLPDNLLVIPRLLSNEEFKYLIDRVDVMVLPYREIEQSGVLLSLINENKPYCCTDAGELAKPIESEGIGWKIENCSETAIAQTLINILMNPTSIYEKKYNEVGWERLKDKYSWKQSNRILTNIYLKLLGK